MTNPFNPERSVNDLIKDSPENIKVWLSKIVSEKLDFYKDFNWILLADVLTQETNQEIDNNNRELSLIWAELAVNTRAVISELPSYKTYFHSNEQSEMMLRARLINRFGDEKNHFLLDSEIIVKWFFERLELSFEEAVKESKVCRKLVENKQTEMLDVKVMSTVRRIKNRLSVIEILHRNSKIEFNSELEKWLEIKKMLI